MRLQESSEVTKAFGVNTIVTCTAAAAAAYGRSSSKQAWFDCQSQQQSSPRGAQGFMSAAKRPKPSR
jgi:hypothetical protein